MGTWASAKLTRILKSSLFGLSVTFFPHVVAAQSVVVDGTTATTTRTDANGKVTVDIAPTGSGNVSVNRYSDFNVGLPGVDLNNAGVNAGTIVNEVTSGNQSLIQGDLTVLGNKADVIIANPNGITVNGGRFVNTGNVGLVTGPITLDANGRVSSQVRSGSIHIGNKGLAGTIEELDLIAKSIKIDGNIQGENPNSIAKVNVHAGDSDVVFDPGRILPDIFPLADVSSVGGSNEGAISVDITRQSTIVGGAIRIAVTDAGAGVRFAGDMATAGGFILTADGKLEASGAQITAEKAVDINVGEVELKSDERQTKLTSNDSGVIIQSKSGNVDLGDSALTGQNIASSNLASEGGVTVISKGNINQSAIGSNFNASITSARDDGITLNAEGNIELSKTSLKSTQTDIAKLNEISLSSSGSTTISQVDIESDGNIKQISGGEFKVQSSQLTANNNIISNSSIAVLGIDSGAKENTQTIIKAEEGGTFLETRTGDFINKGAIIQGKTTVNGEARSEGGVTIISAGDVVNQSIDSNHFGSLFGEEGLTVQTAGNLNNRNGRLFSNAGIRISAAHDFITETLLTENNQEYQVTRVEGSRMPETLWFKRGSTTSIEADYGQQVIANELGLVIALDDLSVDARNIENKGGSISATNIAFNATDKFANLALLTGAVSLKRECRVFCRTSGSSSVEAIGGEIDSAGSFAVTAGNEILLRGGKVSALGDITFKAPKITTEALLTPVHVERPAGVTGFFRGKRGWFGGTYQGTEVSTLTGNLLFDGDVYFQNPILFVGGTQTITGTENTVVLQENPFDLERKDFGLLWSLFE